ncbi:MAG: cysteine methyltransferase [Planctomycetaceae bacterium]|nr:cysteine methyltransferase [Planctomycetaceae bacterium]
MKASHLHKIQFVTTEISLGVLLIAMTKEGICSITFADDEKTATDELAERFPNASFEELAANDFPSLSTIISEIENNGDFNDVTFDLHGSEFRHRVWDALKQIPAGETRTYSEIAEMIGQPTATRAVASACASNPIAVVIPCHRVIRNDGGLGGYRWELSRKEELLKRELARSQS